MRYWLSVILVLLVACGDSSPAADAGIPDVLVADSAVDAATSADASLDSGGADLLPFGAVCTLDRQCAAELSCPLIQTGSGLCTPSCQQFHGVCEGAPPGTYATCSLRNRLNQTFCAFRCVMTDGSGQQQVYACPESTICAPTSIIQGDRFCLPPGTQSCSEISDCAAQCQSPQCADTCYRSASAAAALLLESTLSCQNGALQGACATACSGQAATCNACLDSECAAQKLACAQDTP